MTDPTPLQLQAQIDTLKTAVGIARASQPRLTPEQWMALSPWPAVASGDYNLFDWLRLNSVLLADRTGQIAAITDRLNKTFGNETLTAAEALAGPRQPALPNGDDPIFWHLAQLATDAEQKTGEIKNLFEILGGPVETFAEDMALDPAKVPVLRNGDRTVFRRLHELTQAFNFAFDRLRDVPGGQTAVQVAVAQVKALIAAGGGTQGPQGIQGIQGIQGPKGDPGTGTGAGVTLPPSFQWPTAENGYKSPANSGGPAGPLQGGINLVHNGWTCFGNDSPPGTDATSGPNGQALGIGGVSVGKIRVNTRGGAGGDGGMRDITNYVDLAERPGVGTISRRGFDLFCSVPDALSVRTAVWTNDPATGKRDGGDSVMTRIDAGHFLGNWSDPASDYENRPFVISGGDQPDKDRFAIKAGMDSTSCYGWSISRPFNKTSNHQTYANGGFNDGGDFLLRLFHDDGNWDVGRYSTFRTYGEGRGISFATSDGRYSSCPDALRINPGSGGGPGSVQVMGALVQSSDATLKENISPLKEMIAKAGELEAVAFDWVGREKHALGQDVGFIAQEVEKVFPQFVETEIDTGLKSVAYTKMVAVLWAMVGEGHKELAALKAELVVLREDLDKLKAKV
jgi:Chaperone of endosialidase